MTVAVGGFGPLSDALVGRRRWDDVEVLREAKTMLDLDVSARTRFLKAWAANTLRRCL